MKNTLYRLSGGALIGSFVLSLAGGMAHPVIDGESHSVAALTARIGMVGLVGYFGVLTVAGALLLAVPLPEAPVLTGLQVELARGLMVATIGLGMIRSARTVAPVRENKILMEV